MGRKNLGIMVRYLTGHAHLRRHNKIASTQQPIPYDQPQMLYNLHDPDDKHIGRYDREVMCRLCKLPGTEETPYHIATDCLGAWRTRFELLGCYNFESDGPFSWDPEDLLQFCNHFDLENKPNSY